MVHLFESAIDLLSYVTLLKKVPVALSRFLKEQLEVWKIVFYLDNDWVGAAAEAIRTVLPEKYHTEDVPPSKGKDCND